MDAKLALATAKKFLLISTNGMVEPSITVLRNYQEQVEVPVKRTIEDVTDEDIERVAAKCDPPTLAPGRQIIRVEIECSKQERCRDNADLANLLYGIDDGQVDGSVRIKEVFP